MPRFSLTRFLAAFVSIAVLIGYCSRYGPGETVAASISAVGVFAVILIVKLEHLAFLITVLPAMIVGYSLGSWSMAEPMGNRAPDLYDIMYWPLFGAVLGAIFGLFLLNSVTLFNEKCLERLENERKRFDASKRQIAIIDAELKETENNKTEND